MIVKSKNKHFSSNIALRCVPQRPKDKNGLVSQIVDIFTFHKLSDIPTSQAVEYNI